LVAKLYAFRFGSLLSLNFATPSDFAVPKLLPHSFAGGDADGSIERMGRNRQSAIAGQATQATGSGQKRGPQDSKTHMLHGGGIFIYPHLGDF